MGRRKVDRDSVEADGELVVESPQGPGAPVMPDTDEVHLPLGREEQPDILVEIRHDGSVWLSRRDCS